MTPLESIHAYCRRCVVDEGSAGTWREQVACCPSSNCALFEHRPLPRQVKDGRVSLSELRDEIEARNRAA